MVSFVLYIILYNCNCIITLYNVLCNVALLCNVAQISFNGSFDPTRLDNHCTSSATGTKYGAYNYVLKIWGLLLIYCLGLLLIYLLHRPSKPRELHVRGLSNTITREPCLVIFALLFWSCWVIKLYALLIMRSFSAQRKLYLSKKAFRKALNKRAFALEKPSRLKFKALVDNQ